MFESVREFKQGKCDEITVLVKSINRMTMRGGDVCQKILIRDQLGIETTAMKFDGVMDVTPPAVLSLTIACCEKDGGMIPKITAWRNAEGVGIDAFLPKAQVDLKEAWKIYNNYMRLLRPGISRILCAMLRNRKNAFRTGPMMDSGPFARRGGILEASVKLADLAASAAEQSGMDRDLLMGGALAYYMGYLETVTPDYQTTKRNVLFGPRLMALQMMTQAVESLMTDEAARADIRPEDVDLMGHILAAGPELLPAIPEAVCLMRLDQMIRELDSMNSILRVAHGGSLAQEYRTNRVYYQRETPENGDNL